MGNDVLFSREGSVQTFIDRLIGAATTSVEAALYRINNPVLTSALAAAFRRGVEVRLVLDRNKFEEDRMTRHLLSEVSFPFLIDFFTDVRVKSLKCTTSSHSSIPPWP